MLFLHSQKTSQHQRFLNVFMGNKNEAVTWNGLILSWWRSLSYRNQSIDLQTKSMDWFLYDRDLRHERVKVGVLLNEDFETQ